MYTDRWLALFRILLSTLILLLLLWLALTHWPSASSSTNTAELSQDPTRFSGELAPLLWKSETGTFPGVYTSVTA
jgi:hypothetical protein